MAERAGYDQPGDGYTYKYGAIVINDSPAYQPGFPPPQQGNTQQPYASQQPNSSNTNTTVVCNQPRIRTVIIKQRPPDYMCSSILACLFCFWPTGVCAIYYANEANILASSGDYEGARRMSDNAKMLMISSVVVGLVVMTAGIIVAVWRVTAANCSSY